MTVVAGYSGNITWSNKDTRAKGWTLDLGADVLDTTDFDSAGWRNALAGLKGWTGTVDCNMDSTAINPSTVGAAASAIKLYIDATTYFVGDAFITGWSPSITVDGLEGISLSFQGTSDLKLSS